MGKKKEKVSLDDRITHLKSKQEEHQVILIKILGAIEILEQLKGEEDEETDKGNN